MRLHGKEIMNLKYYLRGLGIGVFVTAVIMGIASGKKQMTDEEVKLRARELGMVESTLLSDMANLTRPEQQESTPGDEGTSSHQEETLPVGTEPKETEPVETKPKETEPQTSPSETAEPVETPSEETEPQLPLEVEPEMAEPVETEPENPLPQESQPVNNGNENGGDNQETVTLTIRSGQSSGAVSGLLADAGLVENALEYDKYLCANGYDKKIRAGTYEIPIGADAESIAKIITRTNAVN